MTDNDESNYTLDDYAKVLENAGNIILHGAPGTGKTYLARKIAAYIVSNHKFNDYNDLSDKQKQLVGFVQFHPSYDYTDFVEGLRPVSVNNQISFRLEDGIFKKFADTAAKDTPLSYRSNYQKLLNIKNKNDKGSEEKMNKVASTILEEYLGNITFGKAGDKFETEENIFWFTEHDSQCITLGAIKKANHDPTSPITLYKSKLIKMIESGQVIDSREAYDKFMGTKPIRESGYYVTLYEEIYNKIHNKYVFIIDEINRGEISKIFGELFFSIDPGYRGPAGAVSTQYSNLHEDPNEKFYIPDNVYIIGTMNDIDRSVESFDFAMRRRFRFINLRAESQQYILKGKFDDKKLESLAINSMESLNEEIAKTPDLNENYQIGPAYFLKLNDIRTEKEGNAALEDKFDQLWEDYLKPLLADYVQGMYEEDQIMKRFSDKFFEPLKELETVKKSEVTGTADTSSQKSGNNTEKVSEPAQTTETGNHENAEADH